MLKLCAFFFLFSAAVTAAHAQSTAAEIETLLQTPSVTYAQAARFVLDASNVLTTANREDAFNYAHKLNWLPKNATANGKARLDAVSLLCMNSFGIKGGILFSITKNPHYAYREMRYLNAIHGRAWPSMEMTGDALLFMVNRLLADRERRELAASQRQTRAQRAADARREALAEEITAVLAGHDVADTTVEVTRQGIIITLSDIQFLADSTQLPASEQAKLREIANILRNIPNVRLLVTGHTALAGTEAGRNAISLERARAVANYLVSLRAVEASNVTAIGYGADRPVADNTTQAGMAANRRVEITILER